MQQLTQQITLMATRFCLIPRKTATSGKETMPSANYFEANYARGLEGASPFHAPVFSVEKFFFSACMREEH